MSSPAARCRPRAHLCGSSALCRGTRAGSSWRRTFGRTCPPLRSTTCPLCRGGKSGEGLEHQRSRSRSDEWPAEPASIARHSPPHGDDANLCAQVSRARAQQRMANRGETVNDHQTLCMCLPNIETLVRESENEEVLNAQLAVGTSWWHKGSAQGGGPQGKQHCLGAWLHGARAPRSGDIPGSIWGRSGAIQGRCRVDMGRTGSTPNIQTLRWDISR